MSPYRTVNYLAYRVSVSTSGARSYAREAGTLAEAAYAPPLFAEIHASKPDASDEAIEYWLRRERKFSPEGAAKARKAYRETTAAIDLAHQARPAQC